MEEATERRQRSDTKCKDFEKVRKDKNKIYETGERNGNCCYIANAGATEKKNKKTKEIISLNLLPGKRASGGGSFGVDTILN